MHSLINTQLHLRCDSKLQIKGAKCHTPIIFRLYSTMLFRDSCLWQCILCQQSTLFWRWCWVTNANLFLFIGTQKCPWYDSHVDANIKLSKQNHVQQMSGALYTYVYTINISPDTGLFCPNECPFHKNENSSFQGSRFIENCLSLVLRDRPLDIMRMDACLMSKLQSHRPAAYKEH